MNNGKASILSEANHLLKQMYAQIDILRKENTALLSESQYVLIGKNELKEETSVLESKVTRLQNEIHQKLIHTQPDLNAFALEQSPLPFLLEPSFHQAPYNNPFYVIPVCSNLSAFPENEATQIAKTTVTKPHPRYPTPSDSWPSQLLKSNPNLEISFRD